MNRNRAVWGGAEWGWAGLTFLLHPLHVHQLLHIVGVIEPQLHTDEGLPALEAEFVPGFWAGQEVGDGALGEPQDGLTKQALTWRGDRAEREMVTGYAGVGKAKCK